jgi:peroxiredoxin
MIMNISRPCRHGAGRARSIIHLTIALYTLIGLYACSSQDDTYDFTLPDIDGEPHRLSDYRGKWVIVNYWATWCKPCLEEIPQLVKLHEEYDKHDVVVLGVNYEETDTQTLRRFMKEHGMSYPVLKTTPDTAQALGPVYGLPMTYVITPQGEIAATLVGQITRQALEQAIETEAIQRS